MVSVAAPSQDSVNGWHSFGPWYLVISLLPSCPRAYRASTLDRNTIFLWKRGNSVEEIRGLQLEIDDGLCELLFQDEFSFQIVSWNTVTF